MTGVRYYTAMLSALRGCVHPTSCLVYLLVTLKQCIKFIASNRRMTLSYKLGRMLKEVVVEYQISDNQISGMRIKHGTSRMQAEKSY
jgi:hypothetical protein